MKNQMKTEAEVRAVIDMFYTKVRQHHVLGPIFNGIITDWEHHLAHITNFWMASLHHKSSYRGYPARVHIEVDYKTNHTITQEHFRHWLQMWFETIEELAEGEYAYLAKERARNMAYNFFMKIFNSRPKS